MKKIENGVVELGYSIETELELLKKQAQGETETSLSRLSTQQRWQLIYIWSAFSRLVSWQHGFLNCIFPSWKLSAWLPWMKRQPFSKQRDFLALCQTVFWSYLIFVVLKLTAETSARKCVCISNVNQLQELEIPRSAFKQCDQNRTNWANLSKIASLGEFCVFHWFLLFFLIFAPKVRSDPYTK